MSNVRNLLFTSKKSEGDDREDGEKRFEDYRRKDFTASKYECEPDWGSVDHHRQDEVVSLKNQRIRLLEQNI